jgi:hypothetical protein
MGSYYKYYGAMTLTILIKTLLITLMNAYVLYVLLEVM